MLKRPCYVRHMGTHNIFRIGTGAGFSSDRLEPAVDLVRHGNLDAIVFECVGERTLAFGHRDRRANPNWVTTRYWNGACGRCCPCATLLAHGSLQTWALPTR